MYELFCSNQTHFSDLYGVGDAEDAVDGDQVVLPELRGAERSAPARAVYHHPQLAQQLVQQVDVLLTRRHCNTITRFTHDISKPSLKIYDST